MCIFCLLSVGFSHCICKASFIFRQNLVAAESIILKQFSSQAFLHSIFSSKWENMFVGELDLFKCSCILVTKYLVVSPNVASITVSAYEIIYDERFQILRNRRFRRKICTYLCHWKTYFNLWCFTKCFTKLKRKTNIWFLLT